MKYYCTLLICIFFTFTNCKKKDKIQQVLPEPAAIKSSNKNITNISFKETKSFTKNIDTVANKIYLVFNESVDITSLTPILTLPKNAKTDLTPTKPLNFNENQTFILTSEDGSNVIYTLKAIQSTTVIDVTFLYDINDDGKTTEDEKKSVYLRQGNPLLKNTKDNFQFSADNMIVGGTLNEPILNSGKNVKDFYTAFSIKKTLENEKLSSQYNTSNPNVKIVISLSGNEVTSTLPISNAIINISKFDPNFNTISGTIKGGNFIDNSKRGFKTPITIEFDEYIFSNIPYIDVMAK